VLNSTGKDFKRIKMSKKKQNPQANIARNEFTNRVFKLFSDNSDNSYNFRQCAGQLGITDKREKDQVRSIMEQL